MKQHRKDCQKIIDSIMELDMPNKEDFIKNLGLLKFPENYKNLCIAFGTGITEKKKIPREKDWPLD